MSEKGQRGDYPTILAESLKTYEYPNYIRDELQQNDMVVVKISNKRRIRENLKPYLNWSRYTEQ